MKYYMYSFLNSVTWIILTSLCAQYPSQLSNGNIVMESITGRGICGKKKQLINTQIIITNGVR